MKVHPFIGGPYEVPFSGIVCRIKGLLSRPFRISGLNALARSFMKMLSVLGTGTVFTVPWMRFRQLGIRV